jgi:hypothetical protein
MNLASIDGENVATQGNRDVNCRSVCILLQWFKCEFELGAETQIFRMG